MSVEDPIIKAVYSPSLGQVACVLLQAALGGDRRACHAFNARDWFTHPVDDMKIISAPLSHWRLVAEMTPEERQQLSIARR